MSVLAELSGHTTRVGDTTVVLTPHAVQRWFERAGGHLADCGAEAAFALRASASVRDDELPSGMTSRAGVRYFFHVPTGCYFVVRQTEIGHAAVLTVIQPDFGPGGDADDEVEPDVETAIQQVQNEARLLAAAPAPPPAEAEAESDRLMARIVAVEAMAGQARDRLKFELRKLATTLVSRKAAVDRAIPPDPSRPTLVQLKPEWIAAKVTRATMPPTTLDLPTVSPADGPPLDQLDYEGLLAERLRLIDEIRQLHETLGAYPRPTDRGPLYAAHKRWRLTVQQMIEASVERLRAVKKVIGTTYQSADDRRRHRECVAAGLTPTSRKAIHILADVIAWLDIHSEGMDDEIRGVLEEGRTLLELRRRTVPG